MAYGQTLLPLGLWGIYAGYFARETTTAPAA
jgi:hypothetical protein